MKSKNILKMAAYALFISGFISPIKAQERNEHKLEQVASFGKSMAIGLSVTSNNRLFVSFPNYDGAGKYALVEVVNGHLKAYPDKQWNTPTFASSPHFLRIQDLFVDSEDDLWVLDSKPASSGQIKKTGVIKRNTGVFSLIKINTKTNSVEKIYSFPDLDKSVSALNDVRVATKSHMAYLSDPGQAAIVILNLSSGRSRSVLAETKYTLADPIVLQYDGKEMKDTKGTPFRSNVNGIALTHDQKYLYFKPINKEDLFRIETRYLDDRSLSESIIEAKVEDMGKVGITHGLIADKVGNIYLTTSEAYAITYLTPEGQLKRLVQDRNLLWPDSMGIGANGYLYISCSQMQLSSNWNNGANRIQYPYRAFRVKLPVE